MDNWTITREKLLSREQVNSLYRKLEDTKDLSIQRRVNHVYVRDYYILRTLLETGLRVFELVTLKVFDLVGNSLIVRHGKGNKRRNIILTTSTKRMLRDFIDIKSKVLNEPIDDASFLFLSERKSPYTTRGIRRRVKYWFKRMGFSPSLSVHSCRHTYISNLMASGVDLVTIRNNAGHSSIAVTDIYLHVVRDGLGDLDIYANNSSFSRTRNYQLLKRGKPQ